MLHDTHNEEVNMISKKLMDLQKAIKTARSAQHESELRDDIRQEEQHLNECEFINENKLLLEQIEQLQSELAQYKSKVI